MHLEALKIFCDVTRWASFSRGAAENGISQSSASQAVQRLEEQLSVKLIDRSKRPLVLTPQGRIFYEGCKELVGRYQEIEARVRSFQEGRQIVGTVHVVSIYSVGLAHMRRYAETFMASHPGAEVRMEYLHPTRVVEAVSKGTAELGLISFPRKWPDLTVIPWRDEPMVLAVPPGHPLAGRPDVAVAELAGEKFVTFDHDLSIRRAIDRLLRRHGVHVEVVLEFDNIENLKRAVEIRSGLAILPEPTLAQEVRSGTLVAVPFRDAAPTRPLAILHRRSGTLDLTARHFLDWLLQATPAEVATTSASAYGTAEAAADSPPP